MIMAAIDRDWRWFAFVGGLEERFGCFIRTIQLNGLQEYIGRFFL